MKDKYMAIDFLGDISMSGIPKPTGFLSEMETGGEATSPDVCITKQYSDGRFEGISGDCYKPASDNQFNDINGQSVNLESYSSYSDGPFQIYGHPTHETPFNLMKDFHTIDKINQEYMTRSSSRLIVAKLDRELTEVDTLTGEPTGNEIFKKGIVVHGVYELNPIIQELSKFGITEDEDIIIKFNYTHLIERLGRPISAGDVVAVYLTSSRLTEQQLINDQAGKDAYVRQIRKIYKINTAVPKDIFLYNYLTIEVNATKTNLDTEILYDWEDCYEIGEVPPDINDEDYNPVPIQ